MIWGRIKKPNTADRKKETAVKSLAKILQRHTKNNATSKITDAHKKRFYHHRPKMDTGVYARQDGKTKIRIYVIVREDEKNKHRQKGKSRPDKNIRREG